MKLRLAAIVVLPNPASLALTDAACAVIADASRACAAAGVAELTQSIVTVPTASVSSREAESLAAGGWRVLPCENPGGAVVPALRVAMRALPLVDAFWLFCAASTGERGGVVGGESASRTFPAMAESYRDGRIRLMRIVVACRRGEPQWPWLIDIGFRQPFVELPDDGDPWAVVSANRTQVIEIEA